MSVQRQTAKTDHTLTSPYCRFAPSRRSYYRFNELFGGRPGQDRVRGSQTATQGPKLDILDEAFTSENWIVRIYQVKKQDPLGRPLPLANAFDQGKALGRAVAGPTGAAGGSGSARPVGKQGKQGRKGRKATS